MDNIPISFKQMLFNLFIIILGYNYSDITCFTIFSIYTFYELSYFKRNDRYNMPVFQNFIQYYGIGIVLEKLNITTTIYGMLFGSALSTIISYEIIVNHFNQLYEYFTKLMNIIYDKLILLFNYESREYIMAKNIIINFISKFMKKDINKNNNFSDTESESDAEVNSEVNSEVISEVNIETRM